MRPTREQGRGRAAEMAAVAIIIASLIVAGAALATPRPAARATTPVAVKPVATAYKCTNSFDPACGPLHWVPAPGPNQPTTTSLSPATARSAVGHALSFAATADDPDASIACHWVLFGDEQAGLIPAISMQRQYGRWNTPAKRAGSYSATLTHTYAKAGAYRVQFGARSGDGCSNDYSPYGGESVSTATVTIAAS